jgi:hypothetical protein
MSENSIVEVKRTDQNYLAPGEEERIVKELSITLPKRGKFSITSVQNEYNISYTTAKRLRTKAIEEWRTNHAEEIELQKEKIRRYLDIIDTLPPDCSRVKQMREQVAMFKELHELDKISPSLFGSDDGEARFIVTGRIGKNMLEIFAQSKKVNVIEQNGEPNNNTGGTPDASSEGAAI